MHQQNDIIDITHVLCSGLFNNQFLIVQFDVSYLTYYQSLSTLNLIQELGIFLCDSMVLINIKWFIKKKHTKKLVK